MISGSGTNLQAIIDAVKQGQINAGITAVISNRADAYGLEIDKYNPDLVLLAGFMCILSGKFISHYRNAILNIHPSLLPEFKGLHTHRRVLETSNQVHGASVHFVNNELDSGPVVIQAQVPVLPGDTEETLRGRVLQQEHIIYPMAIEWFIEGRLQINDNEVLLDNKVLHRPVLWKENQLTFSQQH